MKNHAVNVKIFSLFIFDGTDLMHCFIMFPVLFLKKSISVYIENNCQWLELCSSKASIESTRAYKKFCQKSVGVDQERQSHQKSYITYLNFQKYFYKWELNVITSEWYIIPLNFIFPEIIICSSTSIYCMM